MYFKRHEKNLDLENGTLVMEIQKLQKIDKMAFMIKWNFWDQIRFDPKVKKINEIFV